MRNGEPSSRSRGVGASVMITLAFLSALAPFSIDLYLPAFPGMMQDLSTSAAGVQLSLTAFLIGGGVGQMIFGPLSDRVGRFAPLLVGLLIYVGASVCAVLAPTIWVLVAARLVQGLSGAAGMVIARAMISDLTSGREAARAFSLMMLIGGIAPVIAPVLGSLLADVIGWRGLLTIVAALGATAVVLILLFVRETLPARKSRASTSADGLGEAGAPAPGVIRSLLSRDYLGNACAFAFGFATMMAYISASPFLYQTVMGLETQVYGLLFGLNALALMGVSALSARLVHRVGASRLAGIGLAINLGSAAVITVLSATGAEPLWMTLPLFTAVGSLGLVLGNSTALALGALRRAAGTGSAVLGLLQFGLAGAVAPLVGVAGEESTGPLAGTMLAASAIAAASFALAHRRGADST